MSVDRLSHCFQIFEALRRGGGVNGSSDQSRNYCVQRFSVAEAPAYQRVNKDVVDILFGQPETTFLRIFFLHGSSLV